MNNINPAVSNNSNLDAQSGEHRLAHVTPDEQPYDGAGFPGCGAEAEDSYEDSYLDSYYESQTDLWD